MGVYVNLCIYDIYTQVHIHIYINIHIKVMHYYNDSFFQILRMLYKLKMPF